MSSAPESKTFWTFQAGKWGTLHLSLLCHILLSDASEPMLHKLMILKAERFILLSQSVSEEELWRNELVRAPSSKPEIKEESFVFILAMTLGWHRNLCFFRLPGLPGTQQYMTSACHLQAITFYLAIKFIAVNQWSLENHGGYFNHNLATKYWMKPQKSQQTSCIKVNFLIIFLFVVMPLPQYSSLIFLVLEGWLCLCRYVGKVQTCPKRHRHIAVYRWNPQVLV